MAKRSSDECPEPSGTLLIIGGKEDKGDGAKRSIPVEHCIPLQILKTFAELIKKKSAVVEVITTATKHPEETFNEYKKVFRKLGITHIRHIHHATRKDALAGNYDKRTHASDAYFFTGGDQLLLTSIYGGTPFLQHLKERYIKNKIVIAGTSAGAMALSTPMIYAGSKETHEVAGEIKVTTGLEFLKDVCIDTHFVERGRFVRLAQVIASNPTSLGLGIEEDTAIIVTKGREAEVIGAGIIIVIDGFEIERSNIVEFTEKVPISIFNLKVHLLCQGEKYTFPQLNLPHK